MIIEMSGPLENTGWRRYQATSARRTQGAFREHARDMNLGAVALGIGGVIITLPESPFLENAP